MGLSNKLPAFTLLCAALLSPFPSAAVGLGDARVSSALGERLRAEIPLSNLASGTDQGCFRLLTESADSLADVPWLIDARIDVLTDPPRLLVTSIRPVVEPVVQMAIFTGCGAYLTRHFTILLSPPVSKPETRQATTTENRQDQPSQTKQQDYVVMPGETATTMARRLFPGRPMAQKKFVQGLVARNPDWLTSTAGDEALPEGVKLNYPPPPKPWPARASKNDRPSAMARAKADVARDVASANAATDPDKSTTRVSETKPPAKTEPATAPQDVPATTVTEPEAKPAPANDRLLISSPEPEQAEGLAGNAAGTTGGPASSAEISRRLGEVKSKVAAMRAELNQLRTRYPSPTPEVQTVLIEMETRLLGVELGVESVALANVAGDTPLPAPQAPAMAAAGSDTEPTTDNAAPHEVVNKSANETLNKDSSDNQAVTVAQAPPEEAETSSSVYGSGGMLAVVLGMGLGLGGLLYRRNQRTRVTVQDDTEAIDSIHESSPTIPAHHSRPKLQTMHEPPHEAGQVPQRTAAHDPVDEQLEDGASRSLPVAKVSETAPEDEEPLELAEILLVYGRTQGAIEVFSDHIQRHPENSLQPGLRLLEVYKRDEMRREFETLAASLAHRFNVERPQWDEVQPALTIQAPKDPAEQVPEMFAKVPPHIKSHLVAHWGTQECIDFLQKLLKDKRDGTRRGFPASVTQAILGLIKAMEEELKKQA